MGFHTNVHRYSKRRHLLLALLCRYSSMHSYRHVEMAVLCVVPQRQLFTLFCSGAHVTQTPRHRVTPPPNISMLLYSGSVDVMFRVSTARPVLCTLWLLLTFIYAPSSLKTDHTTKSYGHITQNTEPIQMYNSYLEYRDYLIK